MNQQEKLVLNYPLFDGEKIMESASVVVENGTIMVINENVRTDSDYLLMPGLIDAHTHLGTKEQIRAMQQSGVAAACDVAAPDSLIKCANPSFWAQKRRMVYNYCSMRLYAVTLISNFYRLC